MKVLVPIDFSKKSLNALEYAKKFAKEIMVLHVLDINLLEEIYPYVASRYETFEKFLEEKKREAEEKLSKIEASKKIIKVGSPWKEIIKTAEEENVDLIVISPQKREIEERVLGGTTIKVIWHSTKPVLIVK